MDISKLPNLSVINVFSEPECRFIIHHIEKNAHNLKISDDYGCKTLSAYEMDINELPPVVYNFIKDRVTSLTKLRLEQAFVIKYNKNLIPSMGLHYDLTTLSVVINLNNDFVGGGTNFPLLKHTHRGQDHNPGDAIVFKSDKLNSWHEALSVEDGTRYVINLKFQKWKSIFRVFWDIIVTYSYMWIKNLRKSKTNFL